MEECSETSAYKNLTPGNCPEENIQHASEIPGKLRNVVLEKDGEDQLDPSCEK
jgi:hypothetical protein